MNYDGVITKPELNEETLTHYGVKGMKWRKRKAKGVTKSSKKSNFMDNIRKIFNYNNAYDSEGNPTKPSNSKKDKRKSKGYDDTGNPIYSYTNDIISRNRSKTSSRSRKKK